MQYTKQKNEERIAMADIAVEGGIKHDRVREKLENYGYDGPRLKKGRKKVKRSQTAMRNQLYQLGEQILATENLKKALDGAKETYMGFRKLARMVLKGRPGLMKALGLDKASARSLAGWLDEARQFYANAMASDEVLEKMEKFAVTREKLEKGRKQLENVEKKQEARTKAEGDAVAATKEFNEAMADMDEYVLDLLQVARIALKGSQLLEIMGIVVP